MYSNVNIYTVTSYKSPRQTSGAVGYLIEVLTEKGPATCLKYEDIEETTINGEELLAIVYALRRLTPAATEISIFTDSAYVANAVSNGWVDKWKQNGWKNEKGKAIGHQELWEEMLNLLVGRRFSFHVKEHHSYTNCMRFEIEQRKEGRTQYV